MAICRSRGSCVLAVAATIALGLGSRAVALPKELGDTLYAIMMFWGLAFVAPRAHATHVAAAALAWCVGVEVLQLDHAPWLEALRATTPGRLVLGQGFHAFDLVCYALGAGLAVGSDALLRARHEGRARGPTSRARSASRSGPEVRCAALSHRLRAGFGASFAASLSSCAACGASAGS